jgi:hypothetical protein
MDGSHGFRIGDRLFPWGTRFDEVVPGAHEQGYASRELPCREAFGFPTVYAEVTAARPDRPVMTTAYELSTALAPTDCFARLVGALGQPDTIDRDGEEQGAGSPHSVVLYATWERGAVSFAVSLYGAPRDSDFGPGIGKLYLSWSNLAAAAKPFADAWRAANEVLERAAQAPEGQPAFFTVAWDIFDTEYPPDDADSRALNQPTLLTTPKPVADRLGTKAFALWRGGGAWHLSHGRDTIVLGSPPHDKVAVLEIAPARGGGRAAIEVGPWQVRDAYGSRSIADAAAALERIPGLSVERHQDHDV